MKITNITKGTVLAFNIREALSLSDKLLGMLKKSNIGGSIFRTRFGIHTFFMKEPIDVIILDNNFKVIKLATVKPNHLFFWSPKYSLILELPQGIIVKTKTEIGDMLQL